MDVTALSAANQNYINQKQKVEVKPVQVPAKAKPDKSKIKLIGGVALGAIALGGLIAVGKYKKAQILAEKIDFSPAKTIEEAREFARKQLKIRKFELTDLESANYVNEALVNFNNNISTNHKKIVSCVEIMDGDGLASMGTCKILGGYLGFNEKQFSDFDKAISDYLSAYKISLSKSDLKKISLDEEQSGLLCRWLGKEAMSKKEKVQFYEFLKAYNTTKNQGTTVSWFANLLSNEGAVEFLQKRNLPTNLEDFSKLDGEKQLKICADLVKDGKKLKIQNSGPFGTIYHEIGHALHKENVGAKTFNSLCYQNVNSTHEEMEKAYKKFCEELGEINKNAIKGNVSDYALTGPAEFVAEVYSFLCNGVKFSDDIMDLYKKYGGVIPKNFK